MPGQGAWRSVTGCAAGLAAPPPAVPAPPPPPTPDVPPHAASAAGKPAAAPASSPRRKTRFMPLSPLRGLQGRFYHVVEVRASRGTSMGVTSDPGRLGGDDASSRR